MTQTITIVIWVVAIAVAVWAVLQKRNWVILLMMAVLVGVSVYWIIPPGVKTRLGLDLQGGLQIVYTARTADGSAPTQAQLDQTVGILDRRVNGLGVTESQIQKQGSDQISVALPGIKNAEQALAVIGKTAQLQFFKDDSASRPVGPVSSKEAALKELSSQGVSKAEIDQLRTEGTSKDYALVQSPADTVNNVPEQWYVYKLPPAMTGAAVKSARAGFNNQTGKPNVLIDFTANGSKQFQDITRELYRTGLLKQTPQTFAIVLDNVMESDPMIDYTDPTLRDGISGGAEISGGNMTTQEAKDLAFVLNTGALPVKLETAYQQEVSATLGKDSLNQGLIAGLIGLGIVLLYMLLYYRFLGLVADLALIVYAILLWGLFNLIPVTLTLPGIAGMILTIGVAADANVVIFERIKEEVRRGKTVRSAVNSGYARGFRTILDANVLIDPHGAGALPVRHRRPQGLRVHAHHRRAREHAHRRAVHARHAGRARRIRLLQQAVASWASRPARSTSRRPSWATPAPPPPASVAARRPTPASPPRPRPPSLPRPAGRRHPPLVAAVPPPTASARSGDST